ncbi:conjugative transfer protein TrbF [alpha proteobacterium U9-1i]|nr:conjugative transfer protein TrbF [alpha proteobacterium U9-1i]
MNFPFRKPPRAYAAEPADTPFARAQQAWDTRMGGAVRAAETWRAVAFGAAAIAMVLAGGLTVVALQKRTFVHVVEVSPQGAVLSVRPLADGYTPTDAQVSYFLGHFVRLVREIPTDGIVLRQNWFEAYRFLTSQAAQHLNEIAREDDPFAQLGTTARTVIVTSVVQRSERTWQVSWIEASHGADARANQSFTGLFTVRFDQPRNADALMTNPLGLFITEFSMSPETPVATYTSRVQP